jgi:hypothetical protein
MDDISEALARENGPHIEHEPRFPNRTNVQLLKVLDRANIQIEIWERGAGYTLASGSSSSAAGAGRAQARACRRRITVHMPGGTLKLKISSDYAVTMTGPATLSPTWISTRRRWARRWSSSCGRLLPGTGVASRSPNQKIRGLSTNGFLSDLTPVTDLLLCWRPEACFCLSGLPGGPGLVTLCAMSFFALPKQLQWAAWLRGGLRRVGSPGTLALVVAARGLQFWLHRAALRAS